MRDTTQK